MKKNTQPSSNLPLISVILPVYNGEKYLKEAVNSILCQTISNFELIAIDDGSTDQTLSILLQYKAYDKRLVVISRENRGLVESLNEGIDVARGKWIARMDADDIAQPERFRVQMCWLEKKNADICGSWVKFLGTSDRRVLKHPETENAIKMELLFGSPFAHPTVMMKSALIKKLRYDKNFEKCEDYDLWERAARSGWRMTNVPQVLLMYRQHQYQISTHSAERQRTLAQTIRARYWLFILGSLKLNKDWALEVLKLRDITDQELNMNIVDSVFDALLKINHGESRYVVFDHMTRLYYRAASKTPDIVERWSTLNDRYNTGLGLSVRFKLILLRIFKIRPNSIIFEKMKMLYFCVIRSQRS